MPDRLMPDRQERLGLVATCVLGLEEILEGELRALGARDVERQRGAVAFGGGWPDCWRANWRLRTANRVLVELAAWDARDGPEIAAGARALISGGSSRSGPRLQRGGVDAAALFHPDRTFVIQATSTASEVRDTRWAAMSLKDGLVDGQRDRWGRRSDVDREDPDLHLRLRLHRDRATLLLDTSGEPLDRRGYRAVSGAAPVREQLAAACVLASGWDGRGPVVDPMCGSGTLLIEAAWLALGWAPGRLRGHWAFERLPGYDPEAFTELLQEPLLAPGADVRLHGNDLAVEALEAARVNLEQANLLDRAALTRGDAASFQPPEGPGLVVVNPPHGDRLATDADHWRALGDLFKRSYKGWKAVVLAGEDRGKAIGLRPRRRIPVMNGPSEGRILVFDLY
jgi:putative N6-adenine-specific DNA methylase